MFLILAVVREDLDCFAKTNSIWTPNTGH